MIGKTFAFIFGVAFFAFLAVLCFRKYSRDPFRPRTEIVGGCAYIIGSLIFAALAVGYGFFPESTETLMTSLIKNYMLWLIVYVTAGIALAVLAVIMFVRAHKERNGELIDRKSGIIGCMSVFLCALCVINGVGALLTLTDDAKADTASYMMLAEKSER